MKILHRYILREFLRSFLLSFGTIFCILIVVQCILLLQRHGVELRHVVKILPFVLPHMLSYIISVSIISACSIAFGRLATDNELSAISWCGIHLRIIVLPIVILSLGLSGLCLWINHAVVPQSSYRQARFLKEALQDLIVLRLSLGQRDIELGNHRLNIARVRDRVFYGVSFVTLDKYNRPENIVSSRECRFNYDQEKGDITLTFDDYSGYFFDYKNVARVEKAVGKQYIYTYNISSLSKVEKRVGSYSLEDLRRRTLELGYLRGVPDRDDAQLKKDLAWYGDPGHFVDGFEAGVAAAIATQIEEELRFREEERIFQEQRDRREALQALESRTDIQNDELDLLQASIGQFKRRRSAHADMVKDWSGEFFKVGAEMQFRSAMGWAPLALTLLAIPLAMLLQHPNRIVAFFLSALPVFLIYYPATITGNALASKGLFAPEPALWVGNLMAVVAGAFLLHKVFNR